MSRLLGTFAILGSLVALMAASILVPSTPAAWLPSLLALVAAPFYLLGANELGRGIRIRSQPAAWIAPVVLIGLAIACLAANIGEVTTESTSTESPIAASWGAALGVLTALSLPVFTLAILWWDLPAWARYEGAGTVALAAIVALLARERLVDVQTDPLLLLVVLASLASLAPAVMVMRGPDA